MTYAREPYDWYVEPGWAVDLLLCAEHFTGEILDPACGIGTIPARAIAHGRRAAGSDIVDRPREAKFGFLVRDFLADGVERHWRVDNIICNPPFSYQKGIAEAFIRRALQVAQHKVAMLLPSKFLSSQGRFALFTETPLKRVHYLMSRPSMPPGSLFTEGKIEADGGKVDYCWLVWEIGHHGPATANFLIRDEHRERLDAEPDRQEAAD